MKMVDEKMVGFSNLGLKMIPNDRPRSSQGPLVDFGQQNYFFNECENHALPLRVETLNIVVTA